VYKIAKENEQLRKDFRGNKHYDPITDKYQTSFSTWERIPLYFKSFIECFTCWCGVCFGIVCFLNTTGAIRPDHHGGMFDIPMLSQLANEGAIFDPAGNMNMVASIA
jgi:thiol-disulfide isomerase/thioredoxin